MKRYPEVRLICDCLVNDGCGGSGHPEPCHVADRRAETWERVPGSLSEAS
jgi:hypothetical protein